MIVQIKTNLNEISQQAVADVPGFDHMLAGGQLGDSRGLPNPLVAAMVHYPQDDYQGPYREIVATVGLSTRLVSATLKMNPVPGRPG